MGKKCKIKLKKLKRPKKSKLSPALDPTWGLYIPGYSYPSPAQEQLFKKRYPGSREGTR